MCDLKNVKIDLRNCTDLKEVQDCLERHGCIWSSGHAVHSVALSRVFLLIDQHKRLTLSYEYYFVNSGYTEVFFYDGGFHYEPKSTTNVAAEINYTADWYADCPETKAEWEIFVKIMHHFGVAVFDERYDAIWKYVCCSLEGNPYISRTGMKPSRRKVTLLEAIALLQRPVKTERQMKIEELEATIAKAQEQIRSLKKETDT